jgi:hypothetical protein
MLLTGFVLATGLTIFFAIRMVLFTLHWSDPARQDQTIEAWMPLRYVARSWDVPVEVLSEAVGGDPETGVRRVTVADLAALSGRDVDAVAADLRAAIEAHRTEARDE